MFNDKFVYTNIVCFDVSCFSFGYELYAPRAHLRKGTPLLSIIIIIFNTHKHTHKLYMYYFSLHNSDAKLNFHFMVESKLQLCSLLFCWQEKSNLQTSKDLSNYSFCRDFQCLENVNRFAPTFKDLSQIIHSAQTFNTLKMQIILPKLSKTSVKLFILHRPSTPWKCRSFCPNWRP